MWCTLFPFGLLGDYRFVVILSGRRGSLLLSRRADRTTWETQGGHVEPGETPEQARDVRIWTAVRTPEGWSAPGSLAAQPDTPHWNPVLFRRADGTLLLFCKVSREIADWSTFVASSQDGGRHWSGLRPLVPGDTGGGRGPVKNKPIRLADGALLAPASHERDGWRPFVDRSEDEGATWSCSAYVAAPAIHGRPAGMIQPTLWESRPGRVHMLLRTDAGLVCRSDSDDGGRTWCAAYPTALPNNNSGLDLVRLPDGRLLLAANPIGESGGARTPLALLVSYDNGYCWDTALLLEDGPGEYSYPSIVYDQGMVYLTYTWNRTDIAFCALEVGPGALGGPCGMNAF